MLFNFIIINFNGPKIIQNLVLQTGKFTNCMNNVLLIKYLFST